MPLKFYKVGPERDPHWDTVGLNAYARDCAAWPGDPGDDLMHQSQFTLFRDIGGHLFGPHSREAVQFAMNRLARPAPVAPIELDPKLIFALEAAIERTREKQFPLAFWIHLFGQFQKVLQTLPATQNNTLDNPAMFDMIYVIPARWRGQ